MLSENTHELEEVLVVTIKNKLFQYSVGEIISLIENLEAAVHLTLTMHPDTYRESTYLGKGKIEEVKEILAEFEIGSVVINDNITPAQKRNLEREFQVKVLDRTEIILAIFARRASTKEAQLQVELAQLQYLYPRLTRLWGHLSRQQGGIGMRGVGEKQLEIDKRLVQKRISKLKIDLKKVGQYRDLQRKKRVQSRVPVVALVGYTNAGKSTLFNSFKGKQVFAKDQLFATLDTITKRVTLENGDFYLVDTVGFITHLPHFLIESFKATLEEVFLADLLIHVIDIAHDQLSQNMQAVRETLAEMNLDDRPVLSVYNKIDLLPKGHPLPEDGVAVSVKTGENMDTLIQHICKEFSRESF